MAEVALPKSKKQKIEDNSDYSEDLLERRWIEVVKSKAAPTVRVLQFNTLADALAHDSFFKCPPSALKWIYRGPLLIQEILRSSADICCLEEVDHFQDYFEPELSKHGYEGHFLPKSNSPCLAFPENNGSDGCALFFRSEKFKLVRRKDITLKDISGGPSNQVAILAELLFIEAKKKRRNHENTTTEPGDARKQDECCKATSSAPASLYIAVTHFKAKAVGRNLREAQGKHLIEEVIAFSSKGAPVIIAGDFNASPLEPVYDHFLSPDAHPPLVLQSSYKINDKEPEFTSWKIRADLESKYTIDYIWHSPESLCVKQVWGIPSSDQIGKAALPCMKYPSDHCAICTEFYVIRKEDEQKS